MLPRNLNDSTAVSAVHDGEWGESEGGGRSPEVHDHLHCVQLQVVKTASDSQLLNLLSVSRLVTVLNETDQCGVICSSVSVCIIYNT